MSSTPTNVCVSYNGRVTLVEISVTRGTTVEEFKQAIYNNRNFGDGKTLAAIRYRYPVYLEQGVFEYADLYIQQDEDIVAMFSLFRQRSYLTSLDLHATLQDNPQGNNVEYDLSGDPNADIMVEIMEEKKNTYNTPWWYNMYGSVTSEEWPHYNLSPDQNSR